MEEMQYQDIQQNNYSEKSYSKKVAEIGLAVSALSVIESVFHIHGGRIGRLLGGERNSKNVFKVLNTAVAANMVNSDEDNKETFAAAVTVGTAMYGYSAFKSHAINNIENYYGGLISIRDSVNNFSKAAAGIGAETAQKIKESEGGAVETFLSAANIFKKSKANKDYEYYKSIKETENNLFNIVKSGYEIKPEQADYFKAMEKLNDTYGTVNLDSGFMNLTGRYATSDTKSGIDAEKLFKENTNVSFYKKMFNDYNQENNNATEITNIFYDKMKNTSGHTFGTIYNELSDEQKNIVNKAFGSEWDNIRTENINSESLSKLRTYEFKNKIIDSDQNLKSVFEENQNMKNAATIGQIYNASSEAEQQALKQYLGKNIDLMMDIKLSSNIIAKDNKIYDISFFDFNRTAFDVAKVIEDSFRPIFIMNGKLSSFSPLSVLGLKEKSVRELNKEAVSFVSNNIDYQASIKNAEELVNNLEKYKNLRIDSKAYFAQTNKVYDYVDDPKQFYLMSDEDATSFKKEIEEKIAYMRRESKYQNDDLKNFINDKETDKRVIDFSIKQFHTSSEGQHSMGYSLLENDENNIGQFIYQDKLFIKQNGQFEKQEGNFHFDYSDAAKEHYSKRNEVEYTNERLARGKYIEEKPPVKFDFDILKTLIEQGEYKEAYKELKNSDINFLNTTFNNDKTVARQIAGVVYDPLKFRYELGKLEDLKKTAEGKDITIFNLLDTIITQRYREYNRFNKEVDNLYSEISEKYISTAKSLASELQSDRSFGHAFFSQTDEAYNALNVKHEDIMNLSSEQIIKSTKYARGVSEPNTATIELLDRMYQFKQGEEIAKTKLIKNAKVKNMFDFSNTEIEGLNNIEKENFYKQLFVKEHFKTVDDKIFSTYENTLNNNFLYTKEFAINKTQRRGYNIGEATIVKSFGSSVNFNKGIYSVLNELKKDFFEENVANNVMMNADHWINRLEDTLAGIGIGKLDPHENNQFSKHFYNIFKKRLLPMYLAAQIYNTIDSGVDTALDDDVPFLGAGLTGAVAKSIAAVRIGVQMILENTGIVGAARAIESYFPGLVLPFHLTSSSDYLKEIYFEGQLEEVKKNRFWFFGGRQNAEGQDFNYWRPNLLYIAQHRDSGIYRNKVEKFFRDDLAITSIPWKIIDPYYEEKVSAYERPYPVSEQLFTHVPVIGGMLNATVGQLIKPTKKIRAEEWDMGDGRILNPKYDGKTNDPKFLEYNFRDDVFKGASDAWEDMKTWSGMPGYLASAMQEKFTGKKSAYQNGTTLASLDQATGMVNGFYDLDLGGMMGHTEGIRRILIQNRYKQSFLNPLKNNMPDWMPNNYYIDFKHGDPYRTTPFAQYLLPGKTYKENYGLHSDYEYGEYGLLDRLRILATTAPFSKEYRDYKREAENKLNTADEKTKKHILQSFSYAERAYNKKDIYERNFKDAEVINGQIGIKQVSSYNEFVGDDNKRYKLVGLETNITELSQKFNSDKAANILNNMRVNLQNMNNINFTVNKNTASRVKTDSDGEYIEIYSSEFNNKFKNAKKQNYLVNASEEKGSVAQKILEGYQNNYKPFYMEKIFGRKDAYHSWYDENIVTPSFKDWDRPYESFVQPMMDISSEGNVTAAFSYATNNNGRTSFLLPTMAMANLVKGRMFGPNEVKRYNIEDEMQNKIEFIEAANTPVGYKGANISSIYNMNGNESVSKMKGFLSDSEKNFLPYLVNETDETAREQIMSKAGNRLQNVLKALWYRQEKYVNDNVESPEYNELPTYNNIPNVAMTNDSVLNETIIKKLLGKDMNSFESKILAKYGDDDYNWKRNSNIHQQVEFIMNNRLNINTKTLSSITSFNQVKMYDD